MTTFRITEQTATVVEASYDIDVAGDADEAQEEFEGNRDHYLPVHTQTLRKNAEILSVEEVST